MVRDPSATLNYGAAKKEYYFGRAGLLIIDLDTELPVYVDLQPHPKTRAAMLKKHLTRLATQAPTEIRQLLATSSWFGDQDFVNEKTRNVFLHVFPTSYIYDMKQLTQEERRRLKHQRFAVERSISRFSSYHGEHPSVRANERTRAWVQMGGIARLLTDIYALHTLQPHQIRSISYLRH